MQLLSTKKNKLLLLLPTCLVYVVYIILPILVSLYYSFTKYSGLGEPVWIGLKNYVNLFNDKFLAKSITNTLQMTAVNLITVLPVSFFYCNLIRRYLIRNFFLHLRNGHLPVISTVDLRM